MRFIDMQFKRGICFCSVFVALIHMSCGGAQPAPDAPSAEEGGSAKGERSMKGASPATDAKDEERGGAMLVLRPDFTPHPLTSPTITSTQDEIGGVLKSFRL